MASEESKIKNKISIAKPHFSLSIETDESLEKNLGLPFGEMPEQTPPPEPRETTTAPLEGEDAKQLSPDDMLPEKGRQPQTFQPLPAPD